MSRPRAQRVPANWAPEFCQNASGVGTVQGLNQLGPVSSMQDLLLLASSHADPKALLAAEQIIHLVEAWRYASSAMNAMLLNSKASATHFAYYAELKAVTSLYAWSGIRMKWNNHFYLDAQANKVVSTNDNPATHKAAWLLWPEWIKRQDVQDLLANKVKLYKNATLATAMGAIAYLGPQASLMKWGVDLVEVGKDHEARNDASYECKWIDRPLTEMQNADADLIKEIWNVFLSNGTSLVFDTAFISYLIENAIDIQVTGSIPKSREVIRSQIASHIAANAGVEAADILERLNPSVYSNRTFVLASSIDTQPENVLCRAFFLLRIATLALKSSLATTQNTASSQWIENWLAHAGIWSQSSGILSADIEADYSASVSALDIQLPLPDNLWTGANLEHTARLIRPDACIAWGLLAN